MKHPHGMTDDELRVAVATEVFGWREDRDDDGTLYGFIGDDAPWGNNLFQWHPVRDWSAAGAVVEKMHDLGFDVKVNFHQGWALPVQVEVSTKSKLFGLSRADTAPRAICEAALLAVRAKGGE